MRIHLRSILTTGAFFILVLSLAACLDGDSTAPALSSTATPTKPSPAVDPAPTTPVPIMLPTQMPVQTPTPPETSPSLYGGQLSPSCGLILPALPAEPVLAESMSVPDPAAVEALRAAMPAVAWPAMQRLLDAPESVGLVIYQAGQSDNGVYWNADTPMPLASVAKVIILVAYVEAVVAGEINPLTVIPLSELDRFYLPNFDLGAHRRAVAELREADRLLSPESNNPEVYLQDVAWMMMRHSSNAASDYLHDLLGQAKIEETVQTLGLDYSGSHTAPCTFLGQFLLMANHTRGPLGTSMADRVALSAYLDSEEGAQLYGRDIALLFDAYTNQSTFREDETAWRSANRRPAMETQRFFASRLAPQGTPRAYADLMALLAQNGLSSADSSYQARLLLEWPMRFPLNQAEFSNLGYKNGTLPGVLATVYYGYRRGESVPVVLALFYRDLPQQMYRQWRFDLPHDELARWLLASPDAIPLLNGVMNRTGP
jgi:D-alanyl-D-alanine carboxypeptidase